MTLNEGKADLAALGNEYAPFHNRLAKDIWEMKYQLKGVDTSIYDTWKRIAWALSEPEKDREYWYQQFLSVMQSFGFILGGRINAGAGTDRNVTLFNCFVMGTVPDSLSGIMDALKEAAVTMQQGGGIGYDFSTLRPEGAYVKAVAQISEQLSCYVCFSGCYAFYGTSPAYRSGGQPEKP